MDTTSDIRKGIAAYARSIDTLNIDLARALWLDVPSVSFIHPRGHERGWGEIEQNFYRATMGLFERAASSSSRRSARWRLRGHGRGRVPMGLCGDLQAGRLGAEYQGCARRRCSRERPRGGNWSMSTTPRCQSLGSGTASES